MGVDLKYINDFKQKVSIFPKHSSDLNIIFAVTYAEYKVNVKILETILFPNEIAKQLIRSGLEILNKAAYDEIIKVLDLLNKTIKSILPNALNKKMVMDVQVGIVGDLLSVACTDYFGSVPENMYNKFQDIKNKVNKKGAVTLGAGLMNGMANELLSLKDQLLMATLSVFFLPLLTPMIEYENFLKEHGIFKMLDRMEKIEKCLTKKGVGNRPVADFMHDVPGSNKKVLNSHYFRDQFLMDSKGNFSIKLLDVSDEKRSRFNNIMKSMASFRLTMSG